MQIPAIPPFDQAAANLAAQRQNMLTKPAGAMGQLEALSIQMAGITATLRPSLERKAVILMAADHGVALEGVSAYPQEVTMQMVMNIVQGGAAVNVLARQANARVSVVDIGVACDLPDVPGLQLRKIAHGTKNFSKEPAMSRAQAEQAIQVGMQVLEAETANGLDLVATGEMGIGNTTPSAAITAVLTNSPVEKVTGRGTGVDDAGLQRKIEVIKHAIALHRPDPSDGIDVLSKIGGYEIAGLTGVILAAAARRIPVVVDGFISGAAALVAAQLQPDVKAYLIASHQSVEIGHQVIWAKLGLRPLLNLGLRLGEGTGAVLSFNLIEAAVRILNEMATFGEAGVSEKGA